MKFLAVLLLSLAVLPASSFATSSQVTLNAATATQSVQVTDQEFTPIYGQEDVQTTCTQQVLDHYDTQCSTVYDSVCQDGPDVCSDVPDTVCNSSGCTPITRSQCSPGPQTCTQVPRNDCEQVPVYVNQDYPCTQTETVVIGQTLVKTFNHTINVSAATAAILAAGDLNVTIDVEQDKVTAQLSNAYPAALLNYTVAVTANTDSTATQALTETLVIDVAYDAATLTAFNTAANLSLALGKSALHVAIPGAAELANNLNFNIRIQKHRTLWFPTDLVNKDFDSSSLGITTKGADLISDIPLSKLGITNALDGSQFSVWVTATIKPGNFLNSADFNDALSKKVSQSMDKIKTSF